MDWIQDTLTKARNDQVVIDAAAELAQAMRGVGVGFYTVCSLIGGIMLSHGAPTELVERVLKRIEADDHDRESHTDHD